MKYLLCSLIAVFVGGQVVADEDKYHINFGLGGANEQFLSLPSGADLSTDFIPIIEFGIGKEYELSPEWLLSADLNLSYAEGDIDLTLNAFGDSISSEIKNIGIWAESTIKYTALFDNARPFISVGVGQVYGEFNGPGVNIDGWESGYRLSTGFEFDISRKSTFSIAVATGDVGRLD